MNEAHVGKIARELSLRPRQVSATAELLADGASVPFIARYRKEATDSLDEVAVTAIRDRLTQLEALDQRRGAIVSSLQERELLTPELQARLDAVATMAELEDVYLPFRPKRRTRATVARERGLEPLADLLLRQDFAVDPLAEAARFLQADVATVEDALQGARDIMAEHVNEHADARDRMRRLFWSRGMLRSEVRRGQTEAGVKYRDYFDWSEPIRTAPSHRVLAILRGEAEDILSCSIEPPEQDAIAALDALFVRGKGSCSDQVRLAIRDGYKRLLSRAMETETRGEAKRRADAAAIDVFAQNLRQLLLAPPLGQKRVLAIDPGLRTGCKTVVLDAQGQLVQDTVIYPDQGPQRSREAADTAQALVRTYAVEAIAIGNGTGGRETEAFIRGLGLPTAFAGGDGQRSRRVHLLGVRRRARGVPGPRPHGARRGVDRPAADGPARGARQARSQEHRRRPVPARRRPGRPEAVAG